MSRFFCDSNCELWYSRLDELGIRDVIYMPYTVNGEEKTFDMGREFNSSEFYDAMYDKAQVKTQALNTLNYIDYFEPVLRGGEDIIYVTFTRAMSGTFGSMDAAIAELKEKYPSRKITAVDTKNISMGAGLVVYYAALKHREGASDEEVVTFVESFREKARVYATVNDLAYLKRGGRLSAFKAAMGSILNIKPILSVTKEGKLESIMTVKGRKKALFTIMEFLESDKIDTNYPIALINADCKEDADFMEGEIKAKYPNIDIWSQYIGPVIGCHCGPGTLAVMFITK